MAQQLRPHFPAEGLTMDATSSTRSNGRAHEILLQLLPLAREEGDSFHRQLHSRLCATLQLQERFRRRSQCNADDERGRRRQQRAHGVDGWKLTLQERVTLRQTALSLDESAF